MNCPYCEEPVNHGATVCRTCRRDISLVSSLKEANDAFEQKVQELEAELAEVRERGAAELAVTVVEPVAPPGILDLFAIYLALPALALVGAHYFLVVRFDARLFWLRAASIALPAVFGWMLERRLKPRWFFALALGIVVGLASVFGMSTMVHFTDGDPIMPDSAIAWRETLEYSTSIALSYLLGALIASASRPLQLADLRRSGRTVKLATFIALHLSGKNKGLPLQVRVQRVVRLLSLAASVSTAVGAIFTGFKSIL